MIFLQMFFFLLFFSYLAQELWRRFICAALSDDKENCRAERLSSVEAKVFTEQKNLQRSSHLQSCPVCFHATVPYRSSVQQALFTRLLFNDGVAVIWMSEGYHPSSEWNAMCLLSGRKFLLAPWFPRVIHAVLITTVKALCWGSAALPGPPRFSLWPPWQHRPSAACQPHQRCSGWWESAREWGQGWGCHCFQMKQLHRQFSFLTSYFLSSFNGVVWSPTDEQKTCKKTFIDLVKTWTTNLFASLGFTPWERDVCIHTLLLHHIFSSGNTFLLAKQQFCNKRI